MGDAKGLMPAEETDVLVAVTGLVALALSVGLDSNRRSLSRPLLWKEPVVLLDVLSTAASLGQAAVATLGLLSSVISWSGSWLAPLFAAAGHGAIFVFLWHEGRRAVQLQRPAGLVTAEYAIMFGGMTLVLGILGHNSLPLLGAGAWPWAGLLLVVAGGGATAWLVRRFLQEKEEHRIIRHVDASGDTLQPEYTPASPECPHPERWKMYDSMTAESEVLEFLKCLVTTVKPELVVETGSFMGVSTLWIAEGLRQNGFGKVITCEYDPVVFAKARERLEASGLMPWIECRNQSSLEMHVEGRIDIFFSDSDLPIREQEVRRFLPQISPHGLILMHDAGSHYKIVREAALRLENEGLISVVLVSTPRGLVVAQKRDGRS